MKKLSYLILTVMALAIAPDALAAEAAGNAIFIPVAARTPGALGSEWRTDLVVSNVSRLGIEVPYTITFHPNDGSPAQTMYGQIPGRTSYTFTDVVNSGFGKAVGAGTIMVASSSTSARLTARARIYNVASANGEFGQHVPGVRVGDLGREHHIAAVTGVDGNRANLGIANPWNDTSSFWISVFKEQGDLLYSAGWFTVAPRQVLQINDVFAWLGVAPIANATFEITTAHPAYVYASMVRADSGDPIFVAAVNPGTELTGGVVPPQCTAPAPLHLANNPAEGWIVFLQDGTNAASAAAIFSEKYHFTVRTLYEHAFRGFSSYDVSNSAIAGLRCEPTVKLVQQNEAYQWPGN
ncbi:MAG TPA: hypothetical protein VGF40_12785 [Thermoanaerobaculia bacterium]